MKELKLLAIETSSSVASIALGIGQDVGERTIATPREQTEQVLGLIDSLLGEAECALSELDAIVFGRGPGSFTGLRIAAAVAQGLGLASGCPIVSVSSLAVLAAGGFAAHANAAEALCAVDARMGEVYWARYSASRSHPIAVGDEQIGRPQDLLAGFEIDRPFIALGDALTAYPDVLAPILRDAASAEPDAKPAARDLLKLGAVEVRARRFLPIEAALPVYLRGVDAWT